MKVERFGIIASPRKVTLTIDVPPRSYMEVHQIVEELKDADEIVITKKRKRRSKDANAYMWELVGQIAERMQLSSKDVYRDMVRDYGVYEVLPVKEEHIKNWTEIWQSRGVGWVCEDLGECRMHKGYHNIKTYYGSSEYNTKEMSRLIDGVVAHCKELGIETMTPEELDRMMNEYSKGDRYE